MTDQTQYKANQVVSFKDEGDEGAVLYNPDTDQCVILNPVGAAIWLYLEEPRTLDQVVFMLENNFSEVDTEQAREDLKQFISNFEVDFIYEVS